MDENLWAEVPVAAAWFGKNMQKYGWKQVTPVFNNSYMLKPQLCIETLSFTFSKFCPQKKSLAEYRRFGFFDQNMKSFKWGLWEYGQGHLWVKTRRSSPTFLAEFSLFASTGMWFDIFPSSSCACHDKMRPCHTKCCHVIRIATLAIQSVKKPEGVIFQNAASLRKSAPWRPSMSDDDFSASASPARNIFVTTACTFSSSQLLRVLRQWIDFASKRTSRGSRTHVLNSSISESALTLRRLYRS